MNFFALVGGAGQSSADIPELFSRKSHTINMSATMLRGVEDFLARSELVDFLVNFLHSSVEGGTGKQLDP